MESYRIIATKLEPPHTSSPVVLRERLALPGDWMSGRYRLAAVTGPAGYGKSTLLADWHARLRAQGVAVAWLSLDADDEDPARFINYLIACLRHTLPEVGKAAAAQLQSGALPSFQPVLESLVADLEADGRPLCIFLDDFHLVEDGPPLEMLRRLIDYAPERVAFVVGSRARPRLHLQELQLQGRAVEFTMADLRLSAPEAQQLLQAFSGAQVGAETVEELCRRTEGWPAALQLASLSLRGGESLEETVEDFTGSDRQVCDYLSEVVLAQLPDELRDFLLRSAVLDRFCADLCRAVTGYKNSQALLEALEARGLFLIPLDRKRQWYRYHHLFGDFLRQRLQGDDPDASTELQTRAAQWFRRQGLEEEAIHHALAAQDYAHAAQWIAECAEEVVQRRGAHTTLLRWMRRLPEEYIARWPVIRIHRAWSLGFSRCFDEADRELAQVEAYRRRLGPHASSEAAEIDCMVQLQRATFAALRDRADEARRIVEAWLKTWPDAVPLRLGTANVVLGFACKCNCDFERGLQSLKAARRAFEQSYGYYGTAWVLMVTAVLLAKQGRHQEAMRLCEQGLAHITRQLGPHAHAVHMLSALMAAMHYERDELEQAERRLGRGLSHVREQSTVDPLIAAYQTQARLAFHHEECDRAAALLREGIELGEARDLPRLAAALRAELATQQLRRGELAQAEEIVRLGTGSWREATGERRAAVETSPWGLVRVRLELAHCRPREAQSVLNKLLPRARRLGHGRKLVELLILRALALHQLGRRREALRALREALAFATPAGYVRVFLNEGEPLRGLIEGLLAAPAEPGPEHEHLLCLARGLGAAIPDAAAPADAPAAPVEELTPKEAQILRMLASGRSNAELAGLLFVSTGTVKWHLHNIYGKLQVRNRAAALAEARRLQLLE